MIGNVFLLYVDECLWIYDVVAELVVYGALCLFAKIAVVYSLSQV